MAAELRLPAQPHGRLLFPRDARVRLQACPVPGVSVAAAAASLRYIGRPDLALLRAEAGASIALTSTRNRFAAAPVLVARRHLKRLQADGDGEGAVAGQPLFALVNAGNANAGTGKAGERAALASCAAVARVAGTLPHLVLPFSTGIIGEVPSRGELEAGAESLARQLAQPGQPAADGWDLLADAIGTTDTWRKVGSIDPAAMPHGAALAGAAKGAAMVRPDMATMLAFAATDLAVQPQALRQAHAQAVAESFNAIDIDGDCSTNDCVLLLATGRAGNPPIGPASAQLPQLAEALTALYRHLACSVVEDAEGCSRVMQVEVSGGRSPDECRRVARAVVGSTLLKTALAAGDPNWGRILMAAGNAGVPIAPARASLWVGGLPILQGGEVLPDYTEMAGVRVFSQPCVQVRLDLGRGSASATALGTDLTLEYVRLNSEYRT